MPLVVPGLQSKDGNASGDWMTKLMGKKLGNQHDEMVSKQRNEEVRYLPNHLPFLPTSQSLPLPPPFLFTYFIVYLSSA